MDFPWIQSRTLVLSLIVALSAISTIAASTSALEIPKHVNSNRATAIAESRILRQRSIQENVRKGKSLLLPLKNEYNTVQQSNHYNSWVNGNISNSMNVLSTNGGTENLRRSSKVAGLSYKETLASDKSINRRKYANYYAVNEYHDEVDNTRNSSSDDEKEQDQNQNITSEYIPQQNTEYTPQKNAEYIPQQNIEYTPQKNAEYIPQQHTEYKEIYNTISEDQNKKGYDETMIEPAPFNYIVRNPNYVGYKITTIPFHEEIEAATVLRKCDCPVSAIRSYKCTNPQGKLMPLMKSLGQNMWSLTKLVTTKSLPFVIPLLALKMIIVPLKILKFLKLIKLFLKFFIILPFFVRIVYPALPNNFKLHKFILQKIQDMVQSSSHNQESPPSHQDEAEGRENGIASSNLIDQDYLENINVWDLRFCPSRVSCELGAFLATSINSQVSQNFSIFLTKQIDLVLAKHTEYYQRKMASMQTGETLKAFSVSLGKRWPPDKCQIYKCDLLF